MCLVTGASRGIGKAIALALGAEGAKVVVNYASSEDAAKEVAESIKASGGDAMTLKCNTGDREEIAAMFKQVSDEWGTVDVLVNNAGVYSGGSSSGTASCDAKGGVKGRGACSPSRAQANVLHVQVSRRTG